ncbi:MAG: DoxX family membrane protein [Chitinophagaceae bacterium]|nr:DoxX family membrane protein [Oligoflexus sp.]
MKIAVIICRILLGLGFTVFGANILHPFLPQPPPVEGSLTAQFMAVMSPSHWMQLIGLFQFVGGILVLLGRTAPLGLALLAPLLVNIVAFHVFLQNGEGLVPGLVFSALELFLIYAYRSHFRALFSFNAKPD